MKPLGLAAAISGWMNHRLVRSAGLNTESVDECDPGDLEALDEKTGVILFRNVRELLPNLIKRAQASRVVVRMINEAENMGVQVEDYGVGFDP